MVVACIFYYKLLSRCVSYIHHIYFLCFVEANVLQVQCTYRACIPANRSNNFISP